MPELVSVIVPVYNSERYLKECLKSICGQTYSELEILLLDDGSSDSSYKICREYAKSDSRVQAYTNRNRGVSATRNYGLALAKGDYILFVDADDTVEPAMVECMLADLKTHDADICICGFDYVFETDRRPVMQGTGMKGCWKNRDFFEHVLIELYDRNIINPPVNKLIRADILRTYGIRFCEDISINEDVLFSFQVLALCDKIAVVDAEYYRYLQHADGQSLWNRFHENWLESCELLSGTVLALLTEKGVPDVISRQMKMRLFYKYQAAITTMYQCLAYSSKQCYYKMKTCVERTRFQTVLDGWKKNGMKQKFQILCLKHKFVLLYHLICMAVIRRKIQ